MDWTNLLNPTQAPTTGLPTGVDPLTREQAYATATPAAAQLLLPNAPDITSPGASSPSGNGVASGSVESAIDGKDKTTDDLRAKAWQSLAGAKSGVDQAYTQPAPKMAPPKYSLVEAALGTLLGGVLNQASPYTSEGTKALNAYVQGKLGAAQDQYQNEAAQHAQNIQQALQNYKMTEAQAEAQLQQANQQDQITGANDRQTSQQNFEARQQAEIQSARQYEEALDRDALRYMERLRQQGQLDHDQQTQQLLGKRAAIEILSRTGPGRWLLGYRDAVSNGAAPDDAAHQANLWAKESPSETAHRQHAQLLQEQMEAPGQTLSRQQLQGALEDLNRKRSEPSGSQRLSPLNSFLLNFGLNPLTP